MEGTFEEHDKLKHFHIHSFWCHWWDLLTNTNSKHISRFIHFVQNGRYCHWWKLSRNTNSKHISTFIHFLENGKCLARTVQTTQLKIHSFSRKWRFVYTNTRSTKWESSKDNQGFSAYIWRFCALLTRFDSLKILSIIEDFIDASLKFHPFPKTLQFPPPPSSNFTHTLRDKHGWKCRAMGERN